MPDDSSAAGRPAWSSWGTGLLWFLCGALAAVVISRQFGRSETNQSATLTVASPPPVVTPAVAAEPPPDRVVDLESALATLNPTARAEALRRLGRELAADPERGRELAAHIVNFDDRAEFLRAFVHGWAARDPEAALGYAQSQPSGLLQSDTMAAACGGWATVNPLAAATWAREKTSGPTGTKCLARVAESWASVDPPSAAAWASSLPAGVLSEAALRQSLSVWANQDPAAAAAWITSQPDGRQRDIAVLQLAADWAAQEPQECAEWVAKRAQTHDDAASLGESLAARWSAYDAPAASAWISSLPEGEVRQAAAVMAATTWVTSDPAAATAWVESLGDESLKNQLALDLTGTWASIDPTAALAYAQARTDPALQQESLREVFGSWAQVDGPALDQWLANQPADETSDLAREQLAVARFANNPAAALTTAAAITGEAARLARMESLFAFWAQKNAADARQWLSESDVPSSLRSRLERLAASPEAVEEE